MSGTYLITGGNRGLGLEFARQLAAGGREVIATARDPERAKELQKLKVRVEVLDVADSESVAALSRRLWDVPIDVLINNAGIGGGAFPLEKLDMEKVARYFEVNSLGPLRVTRALLSNLEAGRRRLIVNMTSAMGSIEENETGGYYGYRASKAALNMLTRTMAHDLRPKGFISILLHPGWVRTDMGGPRAPLEPEESVRGMLKVIERLSPADSGRFLDYRGQSVPW